MDNKLHFIEEPLRQVKISMITGISNPITEWFDGLWKELYSTEVNVFNQDGGEIIYYTNSNGQIKVIFYHNTHDGNFLYDEATYNMVMTFKFGLSLSDTRLITKLLVDNVLGITNSKPLSSNIKRHLEVYNIIKSIQNEQGN